MENKRKTVIAAAVALVIILLVAVIYIVGFDYYVELERVGQEHVTVEYGESYEAPKLKAYKKGHIINRNGKEIDCKQKTNVDISKLGSYEVVYTAEYRNKTAKYIIKVDVVDTEKPEITLLGEQEMTVEAGSEYQEPGYEAFDNYEADITESVVAEGSVDTMTVADYSISYRVKDSSGNEAVAERTVHVVDTTAPQLLLTGEDSILIKKGESYSEPGYVASDICDGDLTANVAVVGSVDTSTVGKYTLTYEVSDAAGNKSAVTRTIRVYAPAPTVSAGYVNPGDKVVYLTFDDGPGPYTSQLLDILDKYNVKATFFVTNTNSKYQYLIATEAARGHTVAIHSKTHNYAQIYSGVDAYFDDLEGMNEIIRAQTGSSASIIRFPGGSSNTVSRKYCSGIMSTLVNEVSQRGYLYCDWNVSSGDAGGTTDTSRVVENVISGIQKNNVSVVLQHDIKNFSVNAVEQIIQWGLSEGYTFLPLTTSSPMNHHGVNN